MRKILIGLWSMVGALCVWGGAYAQPARYTLTALELPTGGVGGMVSAANAGGDLVGWTEKADGRRALLWKAGGAPTELALPTGTRLSIANGINAAGDVVGAAGGSLMQRAVLWKANGEIVDIGKNLNGSSSAVSVNSAGQVVGAYVTPSGARAFLWSPTGGGTSGNDPKFEDLGRIDGAYALACSAINNNGEIVGFAQTPRGDRAFLKAPGLAMRSLGVLPGFSNLRPASVDNRGRVAGTIWNAAQSRTFLWKPGIGMELLTPLGATGEAFVSAMLDDGFILGKSGGRACLWNPGGAPIDLTQRLTEASGWLISTLEPRAMANANLLAGTCFREGVRRPVVLKPAAATTATLREFTLNRTETTGGSEVPQAGSAAPLYPVQGRLLLTERAPAGGVTVQMTSGDRNAVPIPERITIPAGRSELTFPIPTEPVTETKTVLLTATQNGVSRTVRLVVQPVALDLFQVNAQLIRAGRSATGTITLNGRAPARGVEVQISVTEPRVVTIPAKVTIAANARSANFPIRVGALTQAIRVKVTAAYGGRTRIVYLTLSP